MRFPLDLLDFAETEYPKLSIWSPNGHLEVDWMPPQPQPQPELWPNDPTDDGNALAGVRNAVLLEGGIVGIIALVELLRWLW